MQSLSQFLPPNFDPQKNVVLIAGGGAYPAIMAQSILQKKIKLKIIAFDEETDLSLFSQFQEDDRVMIKVGQVGKLLKSLKKLQAAYVVMAGQITPKKLFRGMQPDLKAVMLLATLKERNAETIFGAIVNQIEKEGTVVLDARCFMDDSLAHIGLMAKGSKKYDTPTLNHGITIAKEVAKLGIGQGVVVNKGTVLAVEAFEGTNQMIQRAGQFGADNAIFVKTLKSNQDYRFDIPVFGLHTLKVMKEANIWHAALEANHTLILNKQEVLKQATQIGISIIGY